MPRQSHQRPHPRVRPSPLLVVAAVAGLLVPAGAGLAQSAILESVKQNPALARSLCQQLRQLNAEGISATSRQAVNLVAQQQGLNSVDAEVLTTYVVGLHCPDVR